MCIETTNWHLQDLKDIYFQGLSCCINYGVWMCVHVCVHACVRACVRACARLCGGKVMCMKYDRVVRTVPADICPGNTAMMPRPVVIQGSHG